MGSTLSHTPILQVRDLCIEFNTERGLVRATDHLNFDINDGETLGIVGESGCGKSITALAILGLIPSPPGRIAKGSIKWKGQELVGLKNSDYRRLRGSSISMIFQEPMTALNPVFSIENQMTEVISHHNPSMTRKQTLARALDMLEIVGIPAPTKRLKEYPHQLSGGMRQRIMIAMALSCSPELLLADEPTTALDVTTQAQVMDEIKRLQKKFGMAVSLITHDLGVIAESCENVLVMYCGQIVEKASTLELFSNPAHPYTRGLLDSIPLIRKERIKRLPIIEGVVPDLLNLPSGCRFHDRCPHAVDTCKQENPKLHLAPTQSPSPRANEVACFHPYDQIRRLENPL